MADQASSRRTAVAIAHIEIVECTEWRDGRGIVLFGGGFSKYNLVSKQKTREFRSFFLLPVIPNLRKLGQ